MLCLFCGVWQDRGITVTKLLIFLCLIHTHCHRYTASRILWRWFTTILSSVVSFFFSGFVFDCSLNDVFFFLVCGTDTYVCLGDTIQHMYFLPAVLSLKRRGHLWPGNSCTAGKGRSFRWLHNDFQVLVQVWMFELPHGIRYACEMCVCVLCVYVSLCVCLHRRNECSVCKVSAVHVLNVWGC